MLELVEQGEAEIGFIYLGDRQRDSFCTMLERKGLCFEKILPAQDEYDAGVHLVQSMQNKEDDTVSDTQKIWLLLDGGVRTGNYMHEQRLAGALDALQKVGYILTASADELGASSENCLAAEHPDGGKVYLCPGYFYTEDSQKNITEALDCVDPDAVISVCSLAVLYDMLLKKEEAQNKNMQIGAVDCFSETNRKAFETKDIFGNSSRDCIVGKCQAMGARRLLPCIMPSRDTWKWSETVENPTFCPRICGWPVPRRTMTVFAQKPAIFMKMSIPRMRS